MAKAIGYITANYSTKNTSALTESRPVASLPYLGRYRLIDFPLSNMVNAKITSVGIVMPFNYRSLADHVGAGKAGASPARRAASSCCPAPPLAPPVRALASWCAT